LLRPAFIRSVTNSCRPSAGLGLPVWPVYPRSRRAPAPSYARAIKTIREEDANETSPPKAISAPDRGRGRAAGGLTFRLRASLSDAARADHRPTRSRRRILPPCRSTRYLSVTQVGWNARQRAAQSTLKRAAVQPKIDLHREPCVLDCIVQIASPSEFDVAADPNWLAHLPPPAPPGLRGVGSKPREALHKFPPAGETRLCRALRNG
jgi:hypothetical protein